MSLFSTIVFNVGQGDNILIKLPNEEYGLIDFFYSSDLFNSENILDQNEPPSLTYLKNELLSKKKVIINFLHISHYHKDHIKGLRKVIKWIKNNNILVRNFFLPGTLDPTVIKVSLIEWLSDNDIQNDSISSKHQNFSNEIEFLNKYINEKNSKSKGAFGVYISGISNLSTSAKFENTYFRMRCLSPLHNETINYSTSSLKKLLLYYLEDKQLLIDKNLMSTILKFRVNNAQFLFGGDAILKHWESCIKEYNENYLTDFGPFFSTFVKVSHHGSKYSSSEDIWINILDITKQNIIIFSAGNGYGHPDVETVNDIINISKKYNFKKVLLSTNEVFSEKSINNISLDEYFNIKTYTRSIRKLIADTNDICYNEKKRDSPSFILGYKAWINEGDEFISYASLKN